MGWDGEKEGRQRRGSGKEARRSTGRGVREGKDGIEVGVKTALKGRGEEWAGDEGGNREDEEGEGPGRKRGR